MNKILSLFIANAIVIGTSVTAYAEGSYTVNRLYGVDRYKTSVSISDSFNNEKVENVIVASGKDFPDALTGSILSKKYSAPILLLNDTIGGSSDSIDYITNHLNKTGTIYVLGGNGSISEDFVNHMKNLGYNNVIRLGGINRADTNKAIVNSLNIEKGTPLIITNGYDGFADALSISSIAAIKDYPIFITNKTSLPVETKNIISNISPSEVYIIGGTGVVANDVITELKNLIPTLDDDKIIRVAGEDRYETSLNIAKYFNLDTDTAIIANGTNFPDALSGSALATKLNAPIILTDGQDIEVQREFISSKNYLNLFLLGGIGSVDLPIEYSFKDPNKITQEEKNYINSLINSCDELLGNTNAISHGFIDFIAALKYIGSIASVSNPGPALDAFSYGFTDTFNNNFSNLANLGGNIGVLKNKISDLKSPDGLESLKMDCLKSASIEYENVNRVTNYYYDYLSAADSLSNATYYKMPGYFMKDYNLHKNQIQKSIQDMSKYTNSIVDSSQQVGSESEKIQQLKERLERAKQYMD